MLKHLDGLTLVEVLLQTGRYHQIRAQFQAVGCPIAGDGRYGSREPTPGRIALHHRRFEIRHPVRKETIGIEAPYPKGWPAGRGSRRARRAAKEAED